MLVNVNVYDNYFTLTFEKASEKQKEYIYNYLHHKVDVLDSNRFHDVSFTKYHTSDGRTKLITPNGKYPKGLLSKCLTYLKQLKETFTYDYKVIDNQTPKLTVNIPKDIVVKDRKGEKTLTLRDYQKESVVQIFNKQRGIIELATNAGKSAIMYSVANLVTPLLNNNERILLIAPNLSVASQLKKNLLHYYINDDIGFIGNSEFDIGHKIVVSTIQSLTIKTKPIDIKIKGTKAKEAQRMVSYYNSLDKENLHSSLGKFLDTFSPRYKYEEKDKETLQELYDTVMNDKVLGICFGNYESIYEKALTKKDKEKIESYNNVMTFLNTIKVLMCDEIQTAASDGYQRVVNSMNNLRMALGFTGTIPKEPERALKIRALFGETLVNVNNKEMIERGFSTNIKIKFLDYNYPHDLQARVERELAINRVPKAQQSLMRYQYAYREGIIDNQNRNELIAKLAIKLAKDEQKKGTKLATLIIVNSIEHGENIVKEIDKLNLTNEVDYDFIHGDSTQEERERAFKELGEGKTQILVASKIIEAGIDLPFLKNLIYCSGGKSYVSVLQRLGRLLRLGKGKKECIVYDIVDRQHSLLYEHAKKRLKYYKDEGFELLQ